MTDDRPALHDLERGIPFVERHLGPRAEELDTMLAAIGAESLDDLADSVVPDSIRDREPVTSSTVSASSKSVNSLGLPTLTG